MGGVAWSSLFGDTTTAAEVTDTVKKMTKTAGLNGDWKNKKSFLRETCEGNGGQPDKEAWLDNMASRRDIYPNLKQSEVDEYRQNEDESGKVGRKWAAFKQACAGMNWDSSDPSASICTKGCRSCSKGCAGWGAGSTVRDDAALKGKDVSHCHGKCCPTNAQLYPEQCPNGAYANSGEEAVCFAKCKDKPDDFSVPDFLTQNMAVLISLLVVVVIVAVFAIIYTLRRSSQMSRPVY